MLYTPIWRKLGRIITPMPSVWWMTTHTGASFAQQIGNSNIFDIYITGRDSKNRSHIGKISIDITTIKVANIITKKTLFSPGQLGTFDENGVSYPALVTHKEQTYLYYVGWMPTVCTPFNLQLGLAKQKDDKSFVRYSKAPILPRNKDDFLSIGSCFVLIEDGIWKMWYTSFLKWGQNVGEHKHYYVIKYATSRDGINWTRNNHICIDIEDPSEYAICRPTVWKEAPNTYHMWYTYRGQKYRIGYAKSKDGKYWKRQDDLAGIDVSRDSNWDNESICYPHVFTYQEQVYMLYCGNDYGRGGLGLAQLVRP